MKRFIWALAGLLLISLSVPADAAWNIRQKGSGGTVWTDGSVEVPVGSNGILLPLSTFNTSTTYFVPVNKAGNVVKMFIVNSVGWGGIVAHPTVSLAVGNGRVLAYTPISITEANATFTILTPFLAFAGAMTTVVYPVTAQRVRQGDVIRVLIGAPSHGTGVGSPGNLNIVIE